jgi:hypothetical protein
MEPHELDKYIASKLREAENARDVADRNRLNRVWSAIEPQLEKRSAFQWVKMAAVILLLLIPSVFLYLRNREQGREIIALNTKLSLIEKSYRQKLQAFTVNQPDKVIVQHDTIRLVRTIEKKIIPEEVEIIKYVRDTVVIYQQDYRADNLVETKPAVSPSDEMSHSWQGSTLKTEYILSKDAPVRKKKKGHSFQISLGAGNNSSQAEPELAFKTKL